MIVINVIMTCHTIILHIFIMIIILIMICNGSDYYNGNYDHHNLAHHEHDNDFDLWDQDDLTHHDLMHYKYGCNYNHNYDHDHDDHVDHRLQNHDNDKSDDDDEMKPHYHHDRTHYNQPHLFIIMISLIIMI